MSRFILFPLPSRRLSSRPLSSSHVHVLCVGPCMHIAPQAELCDQHGSNLVTGCVASLSARRLRSLAERSGTRRGNRVLPARRFICRRLELLFKYYYATGKASTTPGDYKDYFADGSVDVWDNKHGNASTKFDSDGNFKSQSSSIYMDGGGQACLGGHAAGAHDHHCHRRHRPRCFPPALAASPAGIMEPPPPPSSGR